MDLNLNYILKTIYYICNISSSLLARNKVKFFFKISMDVAFGKTQRFLSQVLVEPRHDQFILLGFLMKTFQALISIINIAANNHTNYFLQSDYTYWPFNLLAVYMPVFCEAQKHHEHLKHGKQRKAQCFLIQVRFFANIHKDITKPEVWIKKDFLFFYLHMSDFTSSFQPPIKTEMPNIFNKRRQKGTFWLNLLFIIIFMCAGVI